MRTEPRYAEQITDTTVRLRRRYPNEQIADADLDARVRGFYREFDTARIRIFVPILVDRLVRGSIEQPRAADSGAAPPLS